MSELGRTWSPPPRGKVVFFYILCKIRRKVVHILSSSSSSVSIYLFLSTHISVQSVFFYLQLVSKTLVPSAPRGTKTFLRGTKSTFQQNSVISTPGFETSVCAIWHPQLLNVYTILYRTVLFNNLVAVTGLVWIMTTLRCCRYLSRLKEQSEFLDVFSKSHISIY